MASKYRVGLSVLLIAVIFLCITTIHCDAQVTFSRDWNAGKRTMDNPGTRATLKSATSVCHLLINQIKQLASCETNSHGDDVLLDAGPAQFFPGQQ